MKYSLIKYSISILAVLISAALDGFALSPSERVHDAYTIDSLRQAFRKDMTMVSGRITSRNTNLPMPLANVFIQGTTEGTYTDNEGRFMLQAPVNTTLVISHVGYLTARIKIGLGGEYEIKLKQGVFHIPLPIVNEEYRLESLITRSPKRTVRTEGDDFMILEQMPNFVYGGYAGLALDIKQKTLAYSEETGLRGRVNLGFTLRANTEVSDFYVLQSDHSNLSKAAESIIRSTSGWIPGKQRGNPVDVRVSLIIIFE